MRDVDLGLTEVLFLSFCLFVVSYFQWYAILMDKTAEFEGTKARISNAYTVKEHFMVCIFETFFFT